MGKIKNAVLGAMLMLGISLVSYGACGMLSGPVQQVAELLQRGPVQVVTVDP